jgi:hypothetical protein
VVVRPSRAQRRHSLPELVFVDLAASEPLGEDLNPYKNISRTFFLRA